MASSVQGGNASGLRVREEVVFVGWWRMQTNRSLFVALVVVAAAILASMLLLTIALVVWLAEWFGSIVWPCVIVGVLMLFVALVGMINIPHININAKIKHIFLFKKITSYEKDVSILPYGVINFIA